MQHYRSLEDLHLEASRLTIGSFDGVHLGHQAIIKKLTASAHSVGAPAVVLTFHPHPAIVLGKRPGPQYLTSPDDRAAILTTFGVDIVITHPFNQDVAGKSAREFLAELHRRLNFSELWVGHDFALGRGREGDIHTLRAYGGDLGYDLHVVGPVEKNQQTVSSSLIREALQAGDVHGASELLGRSYSLRGRVIHGDGRGRTLGIPTANLAPWPQQLIPALGVYACMVNLDGREYAAVTNIGVRPTFTDRSDGAWIETHILDFQEDLYDCEFDLSFVARLRTEKRFSGVEALVEQIQLDIKTARTILQDVSQ